MVQLVQGRELGGSEQVGRVGLPRLAFFRPDRDDLPDFVQRHLDEHVRCLRLQFDVELVPGDSDYDEVCDRIRPDLTLFESGVYVRRDRRIRNTHTHPEIPKLGLLDADAYCMTRSVFLSDMESWGVSTYFTISLAMAAHTPDIADRLLVWPNFADKSVFRTYPGGKDTSILLAGSRSTNYPWRTRVDQLLGERFPGRSLPHGGWFDRASTSGMPVGEGYAQKLSAALIVPTCGTIANELVRKHLEIPASGALLLTESSPAVTAAGFVDMESCVLADEDDVVEKVSYLLANPDELERIAAAGQALAHERHDISNRDQIRQWFEFRRSGISAEAIGQPDPFGALVTTSAPPASSAAVPPSRDRAILARGAALELGGRPALAQLEYRAALALQYMPEAILGMARTALAQGDARSAREWLWTSLQRTVRMYRAATPDPIEWATYVRTLLCEGRLPEAVEASQTYPLVEHPELFRVRRVLIALAGEAEATFPLPGRRSPSVHVTPRLPWNHWVSELTMQLRECGQNELADRAAVLVGATWESSDRAIDEVFAQMYQSRRTGPASAAIAPKGLRHSVGRRLMDRARRAVSALRRRDDTSGQALAVALTGRDLRSVVLAGIPSDDPLALALTGAVRTDPTQPLLAQVGAPSAWQDSPEDALVSGVGLGLGRSQDLVALARDGLLAVGPGAAAVLEVADLAGVAVVAISDPTHLAVRRFVDRLDTDVSWRRLELAAGYAAWEVAGS